MVVGSHGNYGGLHVARGDGDVVAAVLEDLICMAMGEVIVVWHCLFQIFYCFLTQRFWCGMWMIHIIDDEWVIGSLSKHWKQSKSARGK